MAAKKPFREDYTTSIPFLQGIVDFMNRIGHVLNNIGVTSGDSPKVHASQDGIKFELPLGSGDGVNTAGSFGFRIFATLHDDSQEEEGNGTRALPPPFSNLIRAGEGQQDEEEEDPGLFDVRILGGAAQVLGGREHVFPDYQFEEPLPGGTHIYIRYRITDGEGNAVCKWDEEFLTWNPDEDPAEENPFDAEDVEEEGHSLVFELGCIGRMYENGVRQDRVGSILAIATINSSAVFVNPDYEEL